MRSASFTVLLVLFLDQLLKIWVKTSLHYDESIPIIGEWFYIHFIENPGMAFGMQLGGSMGKIILSIFRIGAAFGIGWYLIRLIRQKGPKGLIISISLILAGAIGNILDSTFYGVLFSESTRYQLATFLPEEGGYAEFLHGHVVDMLYFPLVEAVLPEWVPFWGGEYFVFFRPIFNLADASITIGISIILLMQKKFFAKENAPTENMETNENTST